jgi:hypothetical protein
MMEEKKPVKDKHHLRELIEKKVLTFDNVSCYDYSHITDFSYLFQGFTGKTIPPLDTSRVTTMKGMFYFCEKLLEIPYMDTSNVEDMKHMFFACVRLKTIPLLDTSKVIEMQGMFEGCFALEEIPSLNAMSALWMTGMFEGCKSLKHLTILKANNVVSVEDIFRGCTNLPLIDRILFYTGECNDHFKKISLQTMDDAAIEKVYEKLKNSIH